MKQYQSRKAFTLVELVIVIAVIAVLAVVLVPTFSNMIAKAQDSKAMQEAKNAYTNYVADSDGNTPKFMVYRLGERFVALHNGAPIGVFADKESALGAMMDEYDISKLVDTGDGKLWVYELKENDQIKVISDSLSFDPLPEVGDLFDRTPTPVIRMFAGTYCEDLREGKTLQEFPSSCYREIYVTYFEVYNGTGCHVTKTRETGELTNDKSIILEYVGPWLAYQYALSARAIFAATPITQSLDSLEIQEIYCCVFEDDVCMLFVTNHGEYVLYQNSYDPIVLGKIWDQWRPYLMPATYFYEFFKTAEKWEYGVATEGLSEQYIVGDFEVTDWTVADRTEEMIKTLWDEWAAIVE